MNGMSNLNVYIYARIHMHSIAYVTNTYINKCQNISKIYRYKLKHI